MKIRVLFRTSKLLIVAFFYTTCVCQTYDVTMMPLNAGGSISGQGNALGTRNFIPNGSMNHSFYGTINNPTTNQRSRFFGTSWVARGFSVNSSQYPYRVPMFQPNIGSNYNNFLPNMSWDYEFFHRTHPVYGQSSFSRQMGYLFCHLLKGQNYNYIIIRFTKPLKVGAEYQFRVHYSLDQFGGVYNTNNTVNGGGNYANTISTDRIGFALSHTIPEHQTNQQLDLTPFYETEPGVLIENNSHLLETTIVGNGERYLIIGLFQPLDSLTLSMPHENLTNNDRAVYSFDNFQLFDINCQNFNNVYLPNDEYACVGYEHTVKAIHGQVPYTWSVNGQVQNTTSDSLTFDMGLDTLEVIVYSGDGICQDSDTMFVYPKGILIDELASDTTMFCGWNVLISPSYNLLLHSGSSQFYAWRNLTGTVPGAVLSTSPNFTATQPGLYEITRTHGAGCIHSDTIQVFPNEELLGMSNNENDNFTTFVFPEQCVNMFNGSINVFNQTYPDSLKFLWLPSTTWTYDSVSSGLTQGLKQYYISDQSNRCAYFESIVPLNYDSCSIIVGKIYIDTNQNCTLDSLELGLQGITVYAEPTNNFSVTDSLGHFSILVPPGTYTVHQNILDSLIIGELCGSTPINLLNSGLYSDTIFIADTIRTTYFDPKSLMIQTGNISLANTSHPIQLHVKNNGDYYDDLFIKLHVNHPVLDLSNINNHQYFYDLVGDTVLFNISNAEWSIPYILNLNAIIDFDLTYLSDTVQFYLETYSNEFDENPNNNILTLDRIVVAAYDPNVKLVNPMGVDEQFSTNVVERQFTYDIFFQNTGNAPASVVWIKDTLSDIYDLSSFQLVGSSHSVSTFAYNNELNFLFENINLPDSLTDPEGSIGFVSFRINTQEWAYEGDTIQNRAFIFFDNNPPIITPFATNIYAKDLIVYDSLISACDNQIITYNGVDFSQNGVYLDTTVYFAYDSVSVVNFNFFETYNSSLTLSICDNDSVLMNGSYFTQEGEYPIVFQSVNQCDSLVNFQLIHLPTFTSQLEVQICEGDVYDFYGEFIDQEGTYYQYYNASNGCDSIKILVVSFTEINTEVVYTSQIELSSLMEDATYQWVDCNTMLFIPDATNQTFLAEENGLYAVILEQNSCSATSMCYAIQHIGLLSSYADEITIFPNPGSSEIAISGAHMVKLLQLFNVEGKLVQEFTNLDNIDVSHLESGVYLVRLNLHNDQFLTLKFIKQ